MSTNGKGRDSEDGYNFDIIAYFLGNRTSVWVGCSRHGYHNWWFDCRIPSILETHSNHDGFYPNYFYRCCVGKLFSW